MFCYKCGSQLAEGSAFCHSCGSRVVGAQGTAADKPGDSTATPRQTAASQSSAERFQAPQAAAPPVPSARLQAAEQRQGLSTPGVWSIICSIAAVFLIPPVFGGLAIYLGYRAKKAGDRAGDALMIGAVVATVVGMIFGAIVWSQLLQ